MIAIKELIAICVNGDQQTVCLVNPNYDFPCIIRVLTLANLNSQPTNRFSVSVTEWCMTEWCVAIWLTKCQANNEETEPPLARHHCILIKSSHNE